MAKHDVQLLSSPDLAERVLELLASKQSLPIHGILAGQAVASAIDEILGTGPAVYNDIDVFLEEDQWYQETGELFVTPTIPSKKRISGRISFRDTPSLTPDEYQKAFSIASRSLYHVVKTGRRELLNLVLVNFIAFSNNAKPDRVYQLVEAFDLNSIQVGIDLATRRLVYTPQFAEYFVGREMRIINLHTPFQSLLRYFKKRAELGAFGNDDLQIEMVRHIVYANEGDVLYREDRIQAFLKGWRWMPRESNQAFAKRRWGSAGGDLFVRTGAGTEGLPLAIGKKYALLLEQSMPKLAPYFEVWKHPRINVWLLTTRPDAPRLPYIGSLTTNPTLLSYRFRELKLPAGPLVTLRREEFQKFGGWLEPGLRHMYRTAYRYEGDRFLEGVENLSGWRDLQKVLNAHEEVVGVIAALPIGEQIELVRRVKTELKRINLPEAWGIFRGKRADWARRAIADQEWLRREIFDMLGSDEALLEAHRLLPLPKEINGITVKELSTNRELRIEGARMRHCVGGYGDAVSGGTSRIISLASGDSTRECSTVEWRRHREYNEAGGFDVEVELSQHYGFANREPSAELLQAEQALRKLINAWLADHPDEGRNILYADEPVPAGGRRAAWRAQAQQAAF